MTTRQPLQATNRPSLNPMAAPPPPPAAFGVAAFILGAIGFLLFFLPILGAPISALGLIAGIVGCIVAGATSRGNLRWALAGFVVSGLALGINLAINYAPRGYSQSPTGPPKETVPDRPYVSPPSAWWEG